jgi:hypothetical protein
MASSSKKKQYYVCEKCKRKFEKGWSDEECEAEAQQVFPGLPPEERSLVCDDCYIELMTWVKKQQQ